MNTAGPTIERLRVSILKTPLARPVEMSFGRLVDRRICVVEVAADGIWGIGESWINYPPWADSERLATYRHGVAPLLLGRDATDPGAVQSALAAALLPLGRQGGAEGAMWQALSGIDLALWDLAGKLAAQPVHRLLGSNLVAPQVAAYGSGIGPTDVEELCEAALAAGLRAVKTKVGFGRVTDERTVATTRARVGEEVEIFADANQAWSLAEAVQSASWLRDYAVAWLEEPLAGDRISDLGELAAQSDLGLATGENVYGIADYTSYARSGAIQVLQPDLAKAGGFTTGRVVARTAADAGVRLAPHCYSSAIGLAASAHFTAAYPHADWVEVDVRPNPLRTDLLREPWEWADGALCVPDRPGLGVELAAATVARCCVHSEELGKEGRT